MAQASAPPDQPAVRDPPLGGGGLFAALVVGLVVSIVSQSSQAFAHSGIELPLVGDLEPRRRRLRGRDPGRRDRADHLGGHGHRRADRPGHFRVPLRAGSAVAGGAAVDLDRFLAAVPSIVVGLWALLVLSPGLRQPGGAVPRPRSRRSDGSSGARPTARASCSPRWCSP